MNITNQNQLYLDVPENVTRKNNRNALDELVSVYAKFQNVQRDWFQGTTMSNFIDLNSVKIWVSHFYCANGIYSGYT